MKPSIWHQRNKAKSLNGNGHNIMEAASAWEGIAASEPGVQVWRVESFRPVLQKDPKELGKFFTGMP